MEPTKITIEKNPEPVPTQKCFGCVEPNFSFTDEISETEYDISGLCQDCQDEVFGTSEEE